MLQSKSLVVKYSLFSISTLCGGATIENIPFLLGVHTARALNGTSSDLARHLRTYVMLSTQDFNGTLDLEVRH